MSENPPTYQAAEPMTERQRTDSIRVLVDQPGWREVLRLLVEVRGPMVLSDEALSRALALALVLAGEEPTKQALPGA